MERMGLLLIIFCLLAACSSIPVAAIQEKKIAGHWVSEYGTLNIGCGGAFNIDIVDNRYVPTYSSRSSGAYIDEVRADEILVGPFAKFSAPYHVEKWPYLNNGKTMMVIDDREWRLDKPLVCEN